MLSNYNLDSLCRAHHPGILEHLSELLSIEFEFGCKGSSRRHLKTALWKAVNLELPQVQPHAELVQRCELKLSQLSPSWHHL